MTGFSIRGSCRSERHEYREFLKPASLKILKGCKLEPIPEISKPFVKFQFQRIGYFCVDPDSSESDLIFNRTVSLKDTWAKIKKG
jgi:glutaminyl-tRNA synthetase